MLNRFVRQGDSVKRAMKAQQWNEFIKSSDAVAFNTESTQGEFQRGSEQPIATVLMRNELGQGQRGHIRSIIEPTISPAASDYDFQYRMLLKGDTPQHGLFGVMAEAIETGESGRAAIDGAISCKLFVPAVGSWIKRADVDTTDSTRLLATPNGSAQILWQDTGEDTTVDAIVRLANPEFVSLPGKANGNIDFDTTSGVVRIWQNTTDTLYDITGVHLDWMHGDLSISDGKEVLIGWFPDEQLWRVIGAECEDPVPPAIGQMQTLDSNGTQSLTTTPAAWNAFDASETLTTPNVIANEAAATLQIPDTTGASGDLYQTSISGTITPGSNNVQYLLDATVNATPTGNPLILDGRQAGTSLSFALTSFLSIPVGSGPTIGLRIAMAAGTDTIVWNAASFSLEKNLDFT